MDPAGTNILSTNTSLQNGKYIVEGLLGQGGFGITYKVTQKMLGVSFAVKEFFVNTQNFYSHRDTTFDNKVKPQFDQALYEKLRQGFINEARTLFQLDKIPGIVQVRDMFEENDTVYIVMDFIEGKSLQQIIESESTLSEYKTKSIAIQLLKALDGVHKQNVLHRDIKPANILLTPQDDAILIDFGIARSFVQDETQMHTVMLSKGFSPPEQEVEKARKGSFSDLYSLGATLYYCLTGQPPQTLSDLTFQDYESARDLNPQVSVEFNEVLNKMIRKKPQERFQGSDEVLKGLMVESGRTENFGINKPSGIDTGSNNETTRITPPEHLGPSEAFSSNDLTQVEDQETYIDNRNQHSNQAIVDIVEALYLHAKKEQKKIVDSPVDYEKLLGLHEDILCVAASPDCKTIALAGSGYFAVRICDINSKKIIHSSLSNQKKNATSVLFSSDGSKLISAFTNSDIEIWDAKSARHIRTLSGGVGRVQAIALSANNKYLVSATNSHSFKLWHIPSGNMMAKIKGLNGWTSYIRALVITKMGEAVFCSGESPEINIYTTPQGIHTHTLKGHRGSVFSLALDLEEEFLVSGDSYGTIKTWDIAAGKSLKTISGHNGTIRSIKFSPDSSKIISAGDDQLIKIWDAGNGDCLRTIKGHNNVVNSIDISADGSSLVSGSRDQTVIIHDVNDIFNSDN